MINPNEILNYFYLNPELGITSEDIARKFDIPRAEATRTLEYLNIKGKIYKSLKSPAYWYNG